MKAKVLATIQKAVVRGCSFACFIYESKSGADVSRHTVALGVDLARAYRRDRSVLRGLLPNLKGARKEACAELIKSFNDSIRLGIGNNPRYTNKNVYLYLGKGMKMHKETGEVIIFGFQVKREVLVEGDERPPAKSAKAKAKRWLRGRLKTGRFRQYCLNEIVSASIDGNVLILRNKLWKSLIK